MPKEKPLYISVEPMLYKTSKETMLNSQMDMLNSMKHLHNLREIKNEKFQAKMKLYGLFSGLMEDLRNLDQKMPKVENQEQKSKSHVISKVQKIQNPAITMPPEAVELKEVSGKEKRANLKRQSIEDQLREVQEKLKRLNAKKQYR